MKLKRIAAIILICCFAVSCAYAEEEKKDQTIFESVGGWFSQAWEDTSGWVTQAWNDASSWVSNAWGDASKWIGQAWNDSSAWVTDIWGDASTWVTDTSFNIGMWWVDTFNVVTASMNNPWAWIDQERKEHHTQMVQKFKELIQSIKKDAVGAADNLNKTYEELLKRLGLNDFDSKKVMDTIEAFAEDKGLIALVLKEIMLPYLAQLVLDSEGIDNTSIPPVAVAQYLTGIIEKLGIQNENQAQQLLNSLNESLGIE